MTTTVADIPGELTAWPPAWREAEPELVAALRHRATIRRMRTDWTARLAEVRALEATAIAAGDGNRLLDLGAEAERYKRALREHRELVDGDLPTVHAALELASGDVQRLGMRRFALEPLHRARMRDRPHVALHAAVPPLLDDEDALTDAWEALERRRVAWVAEAQAWQASAPSTGASVSYTALAVAAHVLHQGEAIADEADQLEARRVRIERNAVPWRPSSGHERVSPRQWTDMRGRAVNVDAKRESHPR